MFQISNDPFITFPATGELARALQQAIDLMRDHNVTDAHITEILILLATVRTAHHRYLKQTNRAAQASSAPAS